LYFLFGGIEADVKAGSGHSSRDNFRNKGDEAEEGMRQKNEVRPDSSVVQIKVLWVQVYLHNKQVE